MKPYYFFTLILLFFINFVDPVKKIAAREIAPECKDDPYKNLFSSLCTQGIEFDKKHRTAQFSLQKINLLFQILLENSRCGEIEGSLYSLEQAFKKCSIQLRAAGNLAIAMQLRNLRKMIHRVAINNFLIDGDPTLLPFSSLQDIEFRFLRGIKTSSINLLYLLRQSWDKISILGLFEALADTIEEYAVICVSTIKNFIYTIGYDFYLLLFNLENYKQHLHKRYNKIFNNIGQLFENIVSSTYDFLVVPGEFLWNFRIFTPSYSLENQFSLIFKKDFPQLSLFFKAPSSYTDFTLLLNEFKVQPNHEMSSHV